MNKPPNDDKKPKYPPPFSMRFTEDERRVLELAADGRPLAAYIRWLIFKEDMPELPKRRAQCVTPLCLRQYGGIVRLWALMISALMIYGVPEQPG